jgi:hypothetical protein
MTPTKIEMKSELRKKEISQNTSVFLENISNNCSIWGSKLKYMAQSQFLLFNSDSILQIFVK